MLSEKLVNTVARKKIVFVIVEGPSDDEALSVLLEKIYDKSNVYVYITHGDITTEPDADPSTILKKIGNLIDGYAKSTHLQKLHFQEIVHILDMDGAYIPEDNVAEDPSAEKTLYSLTKISTNSVEKIKSRNLKKRKCLDRISNTEKVWSIPYQAYYMSCNLDHVLYDKLNLTDEEKERFALQFARTYKDNITGFIQFISESSFSVTSGYIESWAFIKTGLHSLERHTNLGICFKRAVAEGENNSKQGDASCEQEGSESTEDV